MCCLIHLINEVSGVQQVIIFTTLWLRSQPSLLISSSRQDHPCVCLCHASVYIIKSNVVMDFCSFMVFDLLFCCCIKFFFLFTSSWLSLIYPLLSPSKNSSHFTMAKKQKFFLPITCPTMKNSSLNLCSTFSVSW